jgi:Domain of unknown function (DUF5666)
MPSRLLHRLLGLAALFLAIASCSPAGPAPQAGGGIGGTGSLATVSSGPVTKFGSVFVSGTEYDNTNALYCIDHDPCSRENRLKIGMVVLVNGTRTVEYGSNKTLTQVADTITYEETVEGVVQSVAADGLSLVVLGQVVSVNLKTEIDPSLQGTTLHVLDPAKVANTLVEISGFVTGDGTILATLIQPHTGVPHYEIEGVIKNHDRTAKTFAIGSLIVDYSRPTTDVSLMPSPTNRTWDGLIVFVLGDQWRHGGTGPNGAELTAMRVKLEGLGVVDIQDAEVEDFITQVVSPGDFFINNQRVQTTASTTFEGGTAGDLIVGAHIEVEGSVANGILHAEHISFESEIELQSNVASIDVNANTLTLAGLSGSLIQVDAKTAIRGNGNLTRFEGIQPGDHLTIHGRLNAGNIIVATELERSSSTTEITFQGPVTTVAPPTLTIAGTSIDTSAIPDAGFRDRSGTIDRSGFFNGLRPGSDVNLRGSLSGSSVTWQTIQLGD